VFVGLMEDFVDRCARRAFPHSDGAVVV
jgi:hypothetical protein